MASSRKDRTRIPEQVAADLLFATDHTCCVCRDASRDVQIHHIDENPTKHDPDNLAPLCFHDHNRTQVKGGFGRSLSAAEVRQYRDDWLSRVASRRAKADDLAAVAMAKVTDQPPPSHPHDDFVEPPLAFIFAVPAIRRAAVQRVEAGWSGSTVDMREAIRQYVDALQAVLVALSSYLPASEHESRQPHEFYSKWIADRLDHHWDQFEPDGPGTGGSIVSVESWASVASDVENLVVELVRKISRWDAAVDFDRWKREWDYAGQSSSAHNHAAGQWQHYYPVEFVGPVWVQVVAELQNRGAAHKIHLRWGLWLCDQTVTCDEPAVCLSTNKGPDEFAVAVFVTVDPPAFVTFGTGAPPCNRVVDINHEWCDAKDDLGA